MSCKLSYSFSQAINHAPVPALLMPFLTIPNYQLIQIQQPPPLAELQISDLITNSRMKPIFFIIVTKCWLKAIIPSEEYELDAWKKNLARFWKRITVFFSN